MQVRSLICQKVRHREIAQRNSDLEPGELEPAALTDDCLIAMVGFHRETGGKDSSLIRKMRTAFPALAGRGGRQLEWSRGCPVAWEFATANSYPWLGASHPALKPQAPEALRPLELVVGSSGQV